MKRLNYIFMLLVATTALLTGCNKDDEEIIPELKIDNSTLTIGATQDSRATVVFEVNVNWTATVGYEGETSDWLTLATTNGKAGRIELQLTAAANPSDAARKATIIVSYSEKTQNITVTQGVQETIDITANFDPDFAKVLQEKEYISDATHITLADVKDIEMLSIRQKRLTSLKGIEYFESLTNLDCSWNQLTTLDVSNNTKLTNLECYNNQLTSLDICNNTKLDYLRCYENQLTTLDVSKNTKLTFLVCDGNPLTTLDVNNNTELTDLVCFSNQLTTLDISNNTKLTNLECGGNPLTTLDVSKNTVLTDLYCFDNQLTTLDVSNNTKLTTLYCETNKLTTLDVSKNTALTTLYCYENPGNGTTFPITVWKGYESTLKNINIYIGSNYTSWEYDGQTITQDIQVVE